VTTDSTDFADKKERFPIGRICEIRGQRIFTVLSDFDQ
jgi:hypothetical protein